MSKKKQGTPMSRNEALVLLANWHHSFVSEVAANQVASAMGIKESGPCQAGHSDPGDPKGLTMKPGQEGSRGIAGWVLAQWICDRLNVTYESKLGRGSQAQACVDALAKHFEAGKKPDRSN